MLAYVGNESSLHEAISPVDFLKFLFVCRVRAFALVSSVTFSLEDRKARIPSRYYFHDDEVIISKFVI